MWGEEYTLAKQQRSIPAGCLGKAVNRTCPCAALSIRLEIADATLARPPGAPALAASPKSFVPISSTTVCGCSRGGSKVWHANCSRHVITMI